jgi:hypothetical protein
MGYYKPRYFYGKNQEVKLKLPGGMAGQLKKLSIEDERPSLNREVVYLLGCKLEGIDIARKQRAEKEAHLKKLDEVENEANKLWKTLLSSRRTKDLDILLPDLRNLLMGIQALNLSIDAIPDYEEAGEPGV